MATPLVSIIVTCCNQASFIGEAIRSAWNQTYPHKEIIVVDDGSRDASPTVIHHYAGKKFFLPQSHSAAYARNIGLRHAHGKYALCLDGDDYLSPSFLERTVPIIEQNNRIVVVYTDRYKINGSERTIWRSRPFCRDTLLKFNFIPSVSLFRWKHAVQCGLQDTSLRILEDYDFWLRLTRQGYAYYVSAPLYHYRLHNRNKSKQDSSSLRIQVTRQVAAKYRKEVPVLIRKRNEPAVYEITGGIKRLISNRYVFDSLGFNWKTVIPVHLELFNLYPTGPPINI